ncbi:probable calcium-binding protein CML45 [Papaver somniferum]|uniref:probable calcium-binding protein CML45 n=1 Tax=Papaver somniferum TaxID=3469 RepID=UPI000E6F60AE|nr:probable calcium-binding protein CML45 [Papaver somniferum]
MEKTSANALSSGISISSLLEVLVFHGILKWVVKIQKFYSSFLCFFEKSKSQYEKRSFRPELVNQKLSTIHEGEEEEKEDDGKLSRADVEVAMHKMRLTCSQDGEKIQERLGLDELLGLFEEKEPSVDEVRGAFDVFDENRDGFIDATELQKVLSALGIREGLSLENCNIMIRRFDDNSDGRIDFNEFVKLMENSFC